MELKYYIVAFDESKRKFISRYVDSDSKIEAINDFEWHYRDCTVVNIIEV